MRFQNRLEAKLLASLNNAIGALFDKDASLKLTTRIQELQAIPDSGNVDA